MLNNWIKKGIALFASLTIVITGIPLWMISVSAEETDWTGYTAISTKAELNAVRNNLAGKYYLTQDIMFTEADFAEGGAFYNNGAGWAPLGTDGASAFKGIFDGNGHTISGLYINIQSDSTVYVGIFGYNVGSIKNLGMIGGSVTAVTTSTYTYVGGIAGYNNNSGTIIHCYNTGTINATSTSSTAYAGGITGYNYSSTISNCYNAGNINAASTSSTAYAGGITGVSHTSSTISDCYNIGNVDTTTVSTATNTDAGGITGCNYSSIISNCYNTGNIRANSTYTCVGGIMGTSFDGSTISNCHNTGNIYTASNLAGSTSFAGGIAGQKHSTIISNCYNTGSINTISSYAYVGGITGNSDNSTINCYNAGNVSVTSSSYSYVGGIVGDNNNSSVSSCYNIGNVSVTSPYAYVGGIAGDSHDNSTISNCYNMGSVSATSSHAIYIVGGIAGYSNTNSTISNCYNMGSVSVASPSACVGGIAGENTSISSNCYYLDSISLGVGNGSDTTVPCTLAQMKQQSTFKGFNFDTVWKMSSTYLPYLVAIPFVEAQSISFSKATVELGTGGTYQMELSVNPSIVTFLTVEYTSQSPEIAAVDQNGVVNGVSIGTANIIAKDTISGKTALLIVTVKQGVTGITISGSNQINVGQNAQLTAAISPDDAGNKEVLWSTSDASIATVDGNGLVTGLSGGTVTISAASTDGTNQKASWSIQIIRNAASVSLNKLQLKLGIGDIETLIATVLPQDTTNKTILWSSSDNTVATVVSGIVTAKSLGIATITATTEDGGFISQCVVTVVQPVNGVTLNKNEATIGIGTTQTLVATISPSNATNQNCTWTSSDACVTVNQEGTISGISEGTAIITVQTEDGKKSAMCVITVGKPVTQITMNKLGTTLIEGLSENLTVSKILPEDAINKNVIWSSSNESIVMVDQNGKITAIHSGNAIVSATATDGTGVIGTCNVTVVAKSLSGITVTSKPTKLTYIEGTTLDTTNMALTLTYDNGTTEPVTSGWTTAYDFSSTGAKTVTVTYKGKPAAFDVTVVAKSLSSIAVTTKPTKLTYIEGTALDTTNMALTLTYDNGTTEPVTFGWTTAYDSTSTGTKTVTVTYEGKTATFDVTVVAKSLSGIAVTTKPTKLTYIEGTTLDTTNMALTLTYDNGTTEPVTSGWTTAYDFTSTGTKTVTVTYGGKTATFDVTVVAKSLSGIAVTTKPTKLTYIEGTTLDTTNMALTLTYDNGTTEPVTSGWTTAYDFTSTGTKTVTVTYGGKTATFDVTVVAKSLSGIAVTTKPTKLTYIEGTALDTTNMALTLTYDNGTTEPVTSGWTTAYDFTSTGTKTVTVTYGGKTATFDVTVVAKSLSGIAVTTKPTKLIYIEGTTLDTTNMALTLTYDNGTTKSITSGWTETYDFSSTGTKTITVTYGNKTATFNVTVVAKSLSGITVTTKPTKLTYYIDESLDKTGMIVAAIYDNGLSETVTDYTVAYDFSQPGSRSVTISYNSRTTVFNVTVKSRVPDTITSPTYSISSGQIGTISAGTTIGTLKNGLNESANIKIYKDNTVVDDNAKLGTGMTVQLMDGNTVKQSLVVVVTGDTSGDGATNALDLLKVKRHILSIEKISGAYLTAGDVNRDGLANALDLLKIKRDILGIEKLA